MMPDAQRLPRGEVFAPFRGAPIVVFGASGFIGRWVARLLTASGADLTLVVRSAAGFASVQRRWSIAGRVLQTDLGVPGRAADLLAAARPAAVFNLAGYGVDRTEREEHAALRINRDLPAEVALALAGMAAAPAWPGTRLVHAGTALEYGALNGVAEESGPVRPHTLYGRSKLAGTEAVLDVGVRHGLPSVVARLFTVYGPGEHEGRLLPTLLQAVRSGAPVSLSAGAQRRDFAYVEDVAEGLLRLALCASRGAQCLNLATGELRSVREFAETAARVLGIAEERLRFGGEVVRDDEMALSGVSVTRMRAAIAWAPSASIARGVRLAHDFETAAPGGQG